MAEQYIRMSGDSQVRVRYRASTTPLTPYPFKQGFDTNVVGKRPRSVQAVRMPVVVTTLVTNPGIGITDPGPYMAPRDIHQRLVLQNPQLSTSTAVPANVGTAEVTTGPRDSIRALSTGAWTSPGVTRTGASASPEAVVTGASNSLGVAQTGNEVSARALTTNVDRSPAVIATGDTVNTQATTVDVDKSRGVVSTAKPKGVRVVLTKS